MSKPVTVAQIFERMLDHLGLEVVGDSRGLEREVAGSDISSPGLALAGYVNRLAVQRLQVLGETEISYLAQLPEKERRAQLDLFFSFPIPCVFITAMALGPLRNAISSLVAPFTFDSALIAATNVT